MTLSHTELHGLRVIVVGAAREGSALACYLAQQGAEVTLTDVKPAQALAKHLGVLEGLTVRLLLGTNEADLSGCDILCISPGVPPTAPIVADARRAGVPISSEPRLFAQLCGAPMVGITGSSGKTTTTLLTGQMFAADGKRAWVGGNLGRPLIGKLLEEEDPDAVVMELSSFQLELFSAQYQGEEVMQRRSLASRVVSVDSWSPHIAAVTNITPNHLDRHPSMDDYVEAKSHILVYQKSGDWAVLNADNSLTHAMGSKVMGRALYFSLEGPVEEGAFLRGQELVARLDGHEWQLGDVAEVSLRGRHNLANVLTAACCSLAGGVESEAIRRTAAQFAGVPHRLETVRRWRDVLFVNDSIATSPERAIAAMRSYSEPIVLLAGGRDKHLPWHDWADLVLLRVGVVIAFGELAPVIERALQYAHERSRMEFSTAFYAVDTMDEAVALGARHARPGDVVLLSPGGTSFDAYEDFEARGQRFRDLVAAI